jgi:Protein of unknown function (DUF4058)
MSTNPFPGMDPYLEDPAFWEDFHSRLVPAIADFLLERLPDGYDAHLQERLHLVEAPALRTRSRLPDVAVDRDPNTKEVANTGASVSTLEPISLPVAELHEMREAWVEILHLPERELVTAIEVLSPTNKSGDGYAEYCAKRRELYGRQVNLVEIDLLVGGRRLGFGRPLPEHDYFAFVTRSGRNYSHADGWSLQDPLPTIPVPLKSPDPDVALDLAAVLADAYGRGRYDRRLRYSDPLLTPFPSDKVSWIQKVLQSAGM